MQLSFQTSVPMPYPVGMGHLPPKEEVTIAAPYSTPKAEGARPSDHSVVGLVNQSLLAAARRQEAQDAAVQKFLKPFGIAMLTPATSQTDLKAATT